MEKVLTFGEKLRRIRELRGMDGKDLAAVSGVSAASISDMENGKIKSPKLETVERLANALNISPIYFFESAARTVFDVQELAAMLPGNIKTALLNQEFLPYLLLGERAFQEQIPASVLQKIVDSIVESIENAKAR